MGYAGSTCPVSSPCCRSNYPFTDFSPDGALRERVVDRLSLLRRGVIESTDTNTVSVQFDLTDATFPGHIECVPETCSSGGGSAAVRRVGSSVVVPFRGTGVRWKLEIRTGATDSEWSARLYEFWAENREVGPPPLVCNDYWTTATEYHLDGVLHLSTRDVSDLGAFHGRFQGEISGEPPTYVIETMEF
jgi:hypothetical protein